MTLIADNRELINEWTVESIYGFLNRPEWLEAFCKRHPEYNPDDASCDILDHITSDEDEILKHLDIDAVNLLPNTSGVRNAEEAVFAAQLAREALGTE